MLDDPSSYAPRGSALKAWLFGGDSIPAKAAIFDLATYEGELVSDLFGEDSYFASAEAFWAAQNAAVEAKAAALRENGWTDVIVLQPGQYFNAGEYERRTKRRSGKVYIAVGHRADVTFHEGYTSLRAAAAKMYVLSPQRHRAARGADKGTQSNADYFTNIFAFVSGGADTDVPWAKANGRRGSNQEA